ncbi:S41 family peptidase [Sphaerisporangium rubeum]|uniref:Tricorn protease homolog n=1 Tax=Sphaerisporangium rubeum TaxID=321317 RepID=A0A7X0IEY7_9ACTN|nr:S41 family peptidase [Sphaerisporangium rubeum]MBB6473985.1 tricorn protease [Sphaerisporangium rubeum]
MSAYIRFPAIFEDLVAFTAEDDLWTVSSQGGRAHRLTAGLAEATYPRFSPDGGLLAFVGCEEGPEEVYIMPADGGPARRLTYDAALCTVTTWSPDGDVIYASDARQPFNRRKHLHRVDTQGHTRPLPHGPANTIAYGPGGAVVLGRNTADPARWKRYRGGTVGDLWIDREGDGNFARLIALAGNLASPCWAGDRVYFLSDHEGIGNVYSCTPTGTGLRRHTDHGEYYARNLSSDGTRLVYHSAGDLYLLDPAEGEPRRLDVRLGSSRTQRNRRFASAARYLDSARLAPDGSGLAVTTRGKAYSFGNWEGPVRQHGEPDGVRYRLLSWLPGHDRLIAAASDDTEWETLVVLTADGSADPIRLTGLDTGRAINLEVSPGADRVALANHRNQLLVIDLPAGPGDQPTLTVADHSPYSRITGLTWSPDGDWLAYACPESAQTTAIKLYQTTTGRTHRVTRPVLRDGMPAFDPEGRYLYFIGERVFNPVYDALQFDLGFPLGTRPYAVTLRHDVPSPFVPEPQPLTGDDGKKTSTGEPGQDDAGTPADDTEDQTGDESGNDAGDEGLRIDLDGIERRVIAFPVPEGRYHRIAGLKDKVLFTVHQVTGSRADEYADHTGATLQAYDLRKHKVDTITGDVTDFRLGHDGTTLLLRSGNRLRVVKAGDTPPDDDATTRTSGWIDLHRVKVSVLPDAEWRQMFREAWRLQREHFWAEDMAGIDWDGVYRRYLPLVDKITTRGEFSDLLWELHGELGTSHAYEAGGEYRESPHYWQGLLGADTEYRDGAHVITHIVHGDPWDPEATSPLNRPGLGIRPGDTVTAVNGQPATTPEGPARLLVNQADQEIELTVRRGDTPPRTVTVKAMSDEQPARYRDWVETNRARVHERTGGRVGYLHIPNMGPLGYAEFHRGFLAEHDREGLVVDVRFNGGGHVSGLLLQKLARRRLGYDFPRWGVPEPYPAESPRGPMVAITNELAGSDGDIFSHTFKLLKLGPLVGKRTWGGVIGIWPRHRLADGTVTTQPEFSFAFDDVGWRVENYGTDPDVEVDITPQEYATGVDSQLERAVDLALEALAERPPHTPNPADRPRLTVPPLPPRG